MTGRHARTSSLSRGLQALGAISTTSALLLLVMGAATTGTAAKADSVEPTAVPVFSTTKTLVRSHLVEGKEKVVDTRTFGLSVSQTQTLRDRQQIDVSWTGAHPTGGTVGDHNSAAAAEQEYPVVVMECRGVDLPSAPVADQLSQRTCFTHTPAERFQSDYSFNFPSFRLDRYAAAADRKVSVGQPDPLPAACKNTGAGVQHWIPFDAVNGKTYPGGLLGCAGMAPEAVNVESQQQPTNTAYGATDPRGNGTEKFIVATDETNASLGCSATVACSLVVVPIMGMSCDAAGASLAPEDRPTPADVTKLASAKCAGTGIYQPGEASPGTAGQEDLTVAGVLWWSPSNWRNRISVPLTFAPRSDVCSVQSASAPLFIYGSEMLVQATQQWAPAFCLDPARFRFQHVQTGEPQAKNLLSSGSIEAAFVGGPPATPFARPVVQAPAAVSGFAIAYAIDDGHQEAYHSLKLTPRLLAKLLTGSYPSNATVRNEYPALATNPLDLARDPELRALNPDMPTLGYTNEPASTLFSLSSESDMITALTSYVTADPEARAFLDGQPDPWGMKVNPNYKGISLPVSIWPQLDTFEPAGLYRSDANPCLATSPVPWLGQVAAPVSTLAALTINLQFGLANSQINCANPGEQNQKLTSLGRQAPGTRFLLGLTSVGAAARYQLDQAALQTLVTPDAPAKFTNAVGRTFVVPEPASLRAAADLLQPDEQLGTWPVPYARFHGDAAAAAAYPGTMLLSMDVPVHGLPAADAQRYAQLLDFVAGSGQQVGLGNGQLPAGYLPITAANGLTKLSAYTQAAASAVRAQSGLVPSVLHPEPASTLAATPAATPVPTIVTALPTLAPASIVVSRPLPVAPVPSEGPQPIVAGSPQPAQSPLTVVLAAQAGRTPRITAGLGGLALPLLLGLTGLASLAAVLLLNLRTTKRS